MPELDAEEKHSQEGLSLDPKHFPLDRYLPLIELGSGTSGKVYLCSDRLLKKQVAVKTLRMLSKEQFVAFQTEARATSKLKHPAILSLLDFGPTESGEPYMVLEYFDSQSLDNFIRERGLLDAQSLQQIFVQIASALALSHSMGIFHRDLKPHNILISRSQNSELEVRLIDFGAATLSAFAEDATQSTSIVGTPAYMAPDCAAGLLFDARSDIYSLGCVMFECLSGRPPFEGNTPLEFLSKHAQVPAPGLLEIGVECPEAVADIVAHCLEKKPQDRFQSMNELGEALASVDLCAEQSGFREQLFAADRSETIETTRTNHIDKGGKKLPLAICVLSLSVLFLSAIFIRLMSGPEELSPTPIPLKTERGYQTPEFPERFLDQHLRQVAGRKIKRLNLGSTNITSEGLLYIVDEPLEGLSLSGTPIDLNSALPIVSRMKSLRSLSLSALKVDSKNLRLLKGLKLRSLSVGSNQTIDDEAIAVIAELFPNLDRLYIDRSPVTSKGLCYFKGLKKLKAIDISYTKIDDDGLSCLIDLPLSTIEIGNTDVSGKGLISLTKCKTLKEIKALGTVSESYDFVRHELKRLRPDIRLVF